MKSIFYALAISILIAACQSGSETQTTREIIADTSLSSNYNSDISSDTGTVIVPEAQTVATVTALPTKTVKPLQPAKTKVINSPAPVETKTEPVATNTPTTAEASANTETTTAETAPAEEKKGWSNAAKGTVIGAGAGAVGGAVLSKKKGKGAIIGGVIGAGAGYIIGRDKDKRQDTSATK